MIQLERDRSEREAQYSNCLRLQTGDLTMKYLGLIHQQKIFEL